MLTHDEATERLCKLMGEVNGAINNYDEPADCVCAPGLYKGASYRNSGSAIEFIEAIVKPAIEAMTKVRERERERARDLWENAKP